MEELSFSTFHCINRKYLGLYWAPYLPKAPTSSERECVKKMPDFVKALQFVRYIDILYIIASWQPFEVGMAGITVSSLYDEEIEVWRGENNS